MHKIVNVNDMREWINHPVTHNLLLDFQAYKDNLKTAMVDGAFIDTEHNAISLRYAIEVGKMTVIDQLLALVDNPHVLLRENIDEESKDS